MEPQPADARAAPSACAPTTLSMAMPLPPSHPRSPVKGNMVSPRATHAASTWPEHQHETTASAPRGAHASHCQSLAHHTTLTGRCFKSVDTWAPLSEEPQSRSTTTTPAERLGNQGNSATLAAVHQYSLQQTTLSRASTRTPNTFCSKEQAPHSTTTAQLPGAERTAPHPAHGSPRESQRQTAHRTHAPTYATLKQTHKLTSLHPTSLQKGKGKAPPPPPTIEEETMEEGDDPDFVSDTNNLITIKQKGPTLREIRDTDMGAAITYLLLDLEGVDTEPDILDDGKKGPWTIFATADCEAQFKAKYGDQITLTFSEIPIEFTFTYGEIQTKKGGSSNEQSNARALASALADATTHLVVKINDKSIANRVNLSHFNNACKRVGLKMVKGNREKRKINTPDGLINTSGKKFVWHIYVVPMMGPTLGYKWPRKLLLEIDAILRAIDYVVRESGELGGKDKFLVLHYDPKGCKGYNTEMGTKLMSKGYNIRICSDRTTSSARAASLEEKTSS